MAIPIKTVKTKCFSMNYFKFGSGKKTFVILPGLSVLSVMDSAEIIAKAYEIISKEYTVYVFDRRSDIPDSYSIYDMAEDTAKAFEELKLEDVYLFGASQGGMIASVISLNYPRLVKKLMLGSSSAKITEMQSKTIEKWISLANGGKANELCTEMGRDIYPKEIFEQYKSILEENSNDISSEDLRRFSILAEGTTNFDISNKLCSVPCPVLLLGSSDDKVLPNAAEEIIFLLSKKEDFEYHLYNSFSHAAFDTAPDYKERLLAFANK